MKNACLFLSALVLLALLSACKQSTNNEASDWANAASANRIEVYEQFLSMHPSTTLRDSVARQIERLRERGYYEKHLRVSEPHGFTTEFLLYRPENLGDSHPLQGFPLILGRTEDSSLVVLDCFRATALKNMGGSKGVELNVAADLPPFEIKPGSPYRLSGFWVEKKEGIQPDSVAALMKVQREKLKALVESGQKPSATVWKEFYAGVLAERLAEQDFGQIKVGWLLKDNRQSVLQGIDKLARGIKPGKIFVVQGIEYLGG